MPGPLGESKERAGQRMVWRGVLRAWHLRHRRIHQLAERFIPMHQKKRATMLIVLETPRWQEVVAWQVL